MNPQPPAEHCYTVYHFANLEVKSVAYGVWVIGRSLTLVARGRFFCFKHVEEEPSLSFERSKKAKQGSLYYG